MPEALAGLVGQRGTDYVDDHRPERTLYFSHSRITVAKATPRSSDNETWACRIFFCFSKACNGFENPSTGFPAPRFSTQTPSHLAAPWMPVPTALPKPPWPASALPWWAAANRGSLNGSIGN